MTTAKDLMKKSFVSVNMSDTVSQLIGKTKQKKQSYALVFEKKKYKGLIDKKFLLTSRIDSKTMRIHNVVKRRSKSKTQFFVPKLSLDTDVKEICRLMATANVKALPVIEKQKPLGVVNAIDILKVIKKDYRGIPVTEMISKRIIVAKENDEIGKVIKELHMNGIDRVPVIDRLNKVIGIATLNDLMMRFHMFMIGKGQRMSSAASRSKWADPSWGTGEKHDMLKLPIRNIMTPMKMNCSLNFKCSINQAITAMISEDVSSVIVTKNQMPIGIITIKDILEDYAK